MDIGVETLSRITVGLTVLDGIKISGVITVVTYYLQVLCLMTSLLKAILSVYVTVELVPKLIITCFLLFKLRLQIGSLPILNNKLALSKIIQFWLLAVVGSKEFRSISTSKVIINCVKSSLNTVFGYPRRHLLQVGGSPRPLQVRHDVESAHVAHSGKHPKQFGFIVSK